MPCRVLIVEDDALQAEGLQELLTRNGFVVCGKEKSAAGALLATQLEHPDVVLMDVRLAGQRDGVTVAGSIRKANRCGIVFLTAHVDAPTLARMRRIAPDAFVLSKPSSGFEILRAVGRVSGVAQGPI